MYYDEEIINNDSSDNKLEEYKKDREQRVRKYDNSNKKHNEISDAENKFIPAFKRKKIKLIDDHEDVSENTKTLDVEDELENYNNED